MSKDCEPSPDDARGRLPVGPLEAEPAEAYRELDNDGLTAMLHQALAGVELGAYDRRIVAWLKRVCDQPTLVTLASLIVRARAAGPVSFAPGLGTALEE